MSISEGQRSVVPAVTTYFVWSLFVLSVGVTAATAWLGVGVALGPLVHVDGLTKVMWIAVTFFSGIVQSFSRRYMAANRDVDRFFARVLLFTLTVLVVTAADHAVLFLAAWTAMGLVMATLIGHVRNWPQARAAKRLSRKRFLVGSVLLGAGLAVLGVETGATTITGMLAGVDALSRPAMVVAAGLVLAAALIQSALIPFHGWLLSSMTAPTPSSAIMHAGFVNAGGVLLSRLAPVFALQEDVMVLVVLAGAVSALGGQVLMLVQADYKGRLGCSTVAQMGFMILQCGLGFFAAAVTHLIIHGFYKAYSFLSTGAQVAKKAPKSGDASLSPVVTGAVALTTAVLGGAVFALLTGKGLDPSETGIFLAIVVVVSVYQGASELLDAQSLSPLVRVAGMPAVALPALAVYALVYNGVGALLRGLPMIAPRLAMTPAHWAILAAFLAGHLAANLGWLQRSKRLYVALLNAARADPRTIPGTSGEYDN